MLARRTVFRRFLEHHNIYEYLRDFTHDDSNSFVHIEGFMVHEQVMRSFIGEFPDDRINNIPLVLLHTRWSMLYKDLHIGELPNKADVAPPAPPTHTRRTYGDSVFRHYRSHYRAFDGASFEAFAEVRERMLQHLAQEE